MTVDSVRMSLYILLIFLDAPTRLNVCHPNRYKTVQKSIVSSRMTLVCSHLDESEGQETGQKQSRCITGEARDLSKRT